MKQFIEQFKALKEENELIEVTLNATRTTWWIVLILFLVSEVI